MANPVVFCLTEAAGFLLEYSMFNTPKLRKLFLPLLGCLAVGAETSSAALTFTFTEVGSDVVMLTSGSVDVRGGVFSGDVTGFSNHYNFMHAPGIHSYGGTGTYVYEQIRGVDLLVPDFANNGFFNGSLSGGSGGFIVVNNNLFVFSDGDSSLLDNNVLDATIYSSTREITYTGQSFASMGLDNHALNTPIDLWGARVGATDAERVNFVVSSIPEPSSTAMLSLGGFAFALRRRR